MTDFLDYAEHNGFALFACRAGTKIPALPWKTQSSFDRKHWDAWAAEGKNLAIYAAASGLIILDIDSSKVSREESWAAWCKLCASWGLPGPLQPMTQSARGGWHVAMRRPSEVEATSLRGGGTLVKVSDLRPLAAGEDDGEVIGFKARGYCVAPGSFLAVDGAELPYLFMENVPPPHECPSAFIETLRLPVVEMSPQGPSGVSEPTDVMAVIVALDAHGEFDAEPDWFKALGAIKLACGDTEEGLAVARQITRDDATEEALISRWNRHSLVARPGDYKIGSLIWRAQELTGRKFAVKKTVKSMFADVPFVSTLPHGAVPMFGAAAQPPQIVAPEYSEIEIADRFANDYAGTIQYVTTRRSWVYWTGKRWCADETDNVLDMRRHCRSEAGLCASTPGNTNAQARSINSAKTVNAIIRLTGIDQRIASRAVDWDADPWLLGTPDGIVDLRSGTLRPAVPEDRVTKVTAVSPDGDCPTWLRFLDRSTSGDAGMQGYLQRIAGYCLTGDVSEQALFFLDGKGGNGKGVFVNTLQNILKDYAKPTAIETLTASNSDRHPTDIADLLGARLVTCSETERGKRWAESRIKQMTGGDQLSARFTGKDFFAFTPTFKIVVSGNSKPSLRADDAMRRRFQVVPLRVTIPKDEQDKHLSDKLKREWSGILAWAVAGAITWQKDGLNPPSIVNDATSQKTP